MEARELVERPVVSHERDGADAGTGCGDEQRPERRIGEVERDVDEARRGRASPETAIEIDRNGHGTLLS